jgi:hypothetical protein
MTLLYNGHTFVFANCTGYLDSPWMNFQWTDDTRGCLCQHPFQNLVLQVQLSCFSNLMCLQQEILNLEPTKEPSLVGDLGL